MDAVIPLNQEAVTKPLDIHVVQLHVGIDNADSRPDPVVQAIDADIRQCDVVRPLNRDPSAFSRVEYKEVLKLQRVCVVDDDRRILGGVFHHDGDTFNPVSKSKAIVFLKVYATY